VTRVLPGMQSAFVDIGLERDAFLYVSDFFEDNDEYEAVVSTVEEKVLKMEKGGAAELPRDAGRRAAEGAAAQGETPAAEPVAVSATPTASGALDGRPEGNRDNRDDRRDRGGRGRRGRRRRGGRGSALPESKFFSPSAEPAVATEPDAEGEPEEAEF